MIDPATAKAIIVADYAGLDWCGEYSQQESLSVDGIEATLWWHDTEGLGLCIRGSNDWWDWLRNFRFFPRWTGIGEGEGAGDSGRLYHRGMIDEARVVYAWTLRIDMAWVIGHSRGGGVAQIVGSSRSAPTITFAAPRVLAPMQSQPPGSEQVRNLILGCDIVPRLPISYAHVGGVQRQSCKSWGFQHAASSYPGSGWGEMGWPED